MALSVKLDLAMAHTSWAGASLPGLRARPLPEGEMTCGLPTQRRSHLSRAAGEVAVSAAGGDRQHRRGISIIEVLFAMGVISIGLLGVMSIVPVGLNLIGKGQVSDRSSRAGQNGWREFSTRGMARADQWAYFHPQGAWRRATWSRGFDPPTGRSFWGTADDDDGDGDYDNSGEAGWFDDAGNPTDKLIDYPVPGVSFLIDPRFLASKTLPPLVPTARLNFERHGPLDPNGNEFPYRRLLPVAGTEQPLLKMARVSLKRFPTANASVMVPMGKAHADKIFMLDDDLVFEVPEQADGPPEPMYSWTVGGDGSWGVDTVDDDGINGVDDPGEAGWVGSDDVPVLRQFQGEYSWMATMVPKRDQVGEISDRYILSIVVFRKRDPLLEMNLTNERVAYVPATDFYSAGYSGGDVRLHAYRNSVDPVGELEAQSGDWVVMAAPLFHPTRGATPYFRWYRVTSVSEVEDTVIGGFRSVTRDVTLEGPDWPIEAMRSHPTMDGRLDDTRVTLVSDVVAVYERSVVIETN